MAAIIKTIETKYHSFARNNYGVYPNILILSNDMFSILIKECEIEFDKSPLNSVYQYRGMEISIIANWWKKGIIKMAKD